MLRQRTLILFAIYALLLPTAALARTSGKIYQAPDEVIEKIMKEGMGDNSKVMNTMSYLSDVIGGRLTNSPNMKRANEWTRDTMTKWGMSNAHLESWGPFGRGWSLKEFSAQVVDPQGIPVIGYPKAWSPSTKGTITGDVVYFTFKTDADLAKYKGQLKNAIVFTSEIRDIKAEFEAMAERFTDTQLLEMANAPDPAQSTSGGRNFTPEIIKQLLESQALNIKALNMLIAEGAAVVVDNSRAGSGGTVFVQGANTAGEAPKTIEEMFNRANRSNPWDKDAETKMIPQMTLATEDYNRVARMIKQGEKVRMKINIATQYHDGDMMGYNTVAEIPGTDPKLKDEVVMLGGHLDSWHASGGATDNAAGCAVAMEAARILLATGLKPRRTIRVALWSGEEQGLYGSQAYVKQHFGEMDGGGFFARLSGGAPGKLVTKPDYEKFSAYFNMDNGTGKFRGVYLQGNSAAASIFRVWLEPFAKMGASTLTLQNTGGTDHLSFDGIGLPGFQFIQDEIEYGTRTHHSNQDNYDRIQADDMKQNATMMAAFVYQTAMMDDRFPRKETVKP